MNRWMIWVAGACGIAFVSVLVVQLLLLQTQLFWVALPFGGVVALLARTYVMSRRP